MDAWVLPYIFDIRNNCICEVYKMFKVEVVKRGDFELEGNMTWRYVDSPALRRIIEWAIQEPLEEFVHRLLVKVCSTIGAPEAEVADFYVRVVYSREPKLGFCYHRNMGKGGRVAGLPDILAGFANDVPDFAESIAHEALHALGWDEKVVEEKAVGIVKGFPMDLT